MARVLIIDDEEAIRFVFQKFLTDAGFDVSLAAHEDQARHLLSSHQFDVALVDRILSDGKNGLEILNEIKELQPSCEIIMMSGLPVRDLNNGPEDESFVYLAKPVKKAEIVRAVKTAHEKAQTRLRHDKEAAK